MTGSQTGSISAMNYIALHCSYTSNAADCGTSAWHRYAIFAFHLTYSISEKAYNRLLYMVYKFSNIGGFINKFGYTAPINVIRRTFVCSLEIKNIISPSFPLNYGLAFQNSAICCNVWNPSERRGIPYMMELCHVLQYQIVLYCTEPVLYSTTDTTVQEA